ncbi:Z1 domain-containing protein [Candidatus Poseidoniales archaeon]|nr:Z1 domain-containing protein [Candidatus Poseidoniales archaeon]
MPQTIIREGEARKITWWEQYVGSLKGQYGISSSFSLQAIEEIDRSTNEILSTDNFPEFESDIWNENNGLRIGAAVGSIQSGKTASMIGLAAKGFDKGFKIVIVLCGLKNDLRSQTANRFTRDLLCRGEKIMFEGEVLGFNHPLGKGKHGPRKDCWSPSISGDVNHQAGLVRRKLRTELRKGNNVLIVAKKNVNTLDSLGDAISSLCQRIPASDVPLLIIDDEFDEASVQRNEEAPTPERITQIWGERGHKVAYVGYTATIQANILQHRSNVLWPKNFIELLRFPAARDSPLTFFEPNPNSRYTGPEVYFNYLENHNERNFLIDSGMDDAEFTGLFLANEKLEEALISYFISGAIRLLISGKSLNDTSNLVSPHSMLIHTELEIEEHWGAVKRVMRLIRDKGNDSTSIPPNYRKIHALDRIESSNLVSWFEREIRIWEESYNSFVVSSRVITRIQPDRERYEFPSWENVKMVLPEVFDNTKLRVVNSDDLSKDLDFSSKTNADGSNDLPEDLYSIIIGGNKLSRGLTLEGLCISYFCRSSETIAEDTTVQRERWFGYRGPHLEFCRLFSNHMMVNSLARFVYHEIDLKEQFAESKRQGIKHWDSHAFRFLRMAHSTPSHATGRGQIRNIQFSGTKPFIQRIQMGDDESSLDYARQNLIVFSSICDNIIDDGKPISNADGKVIGHCIYNKPVDEVINLLEGLKFTFHNPNPNTRRYVNLRGELKPTDTERASTIGFSQAQDPYLIAAYLKFWKKGFENRTTGLQNNFGFEWEHSCPPKFNIAIRFGSLSPEGPFNFSLMDREISNDGLMTSAWGSRGYGSPHMDEWFDEPGPHDRLPLFRHRGRNGLILIHVVSKDSRGRNGTGEKYQYPRPTLALNIPQGGPSVLSVDVGE